MNIRKNFTNFLALSTQTTKYWDTKSENTLTTSIQKPEDNHRIVLMIKHRHP